MATSKSYKGLEAWQASIAAVERIYAVTRRFPDEERFGLTSQLRRACVSMPANIALEEPLGYLDFLCLEANSAVVLTDSGGIQEETTALGIDCLTLRENTERPVTIELGTNRLAGTKSPTILAAWKTMRASPLRGVCPPLWDGRASERCLTALRDYFLAEPKHNESAVQTKAERTLR